MPPLDDVAQPAGRAHHQMHARTQPLAHRTHLRAADGGERGHAEEGAERAHLVQAKEEEEVVKEAEVVVV